MNAMKKKPRPRTQREISQEKRSQEGYVTIHNRLKKQPVSIQLRSPKGVDFYVGEQTIQLMAGKVAKFPVHRLYKHQIINHQKAGRIRVLHGSLDKAK